MVIVTRDNNELDPLSDMLQFYFLSVFFFCNPFFFYFSAPFPTTCSANQSYLKKNFFFLRKTTDMKKEKEQGFSVFFFHGLLLFPCFFFVCLACAYPIMRKHVLLFSYWEIFPFSFSFFISLLSTFYKAPAP